MTSDATLRMALVQGLGVLRQWGELAGSFVQESAGLAQESPFVAGLIERGRDLRDLTQSVVPSLFPGAARLLAGYNRTMATWRRTSLYLESVLAKSPHLRRHPQWLALMDIVTGPTSLDAEGFPQLVPVTYNLFRDQVPHLFGHGLDLLNWLHDVEGVLKFQKDIPEEARASILRGVKALKTMTLTASVTAPSDLWLLRQILETHQQLGTLSRLNAGEAIDPETYGERNGLEPRQLSHDLEFLQARGYLDRTEAGFIRALNVGGWVASPDQVELGYRLMPIVMDLKASGVLDGIKRGQALDLQDFEVGRVLQEAGLLRRGLVTELGERVFERGSGVFGIIGAYHEYLNQHEALLRAAGERPKVKRGPNIFASLAANQKVFDAANEMVALFLEETGFELKVYVEHAFGLGAAVRGFSKKPGHEDVQWVGADYEEEALEKARQEQRAGRLPANLKFIQADIGLPDKLIGFIRDQGLRTENTLMVAGNGFHEVRNQTDERMVKVFEKYREAGMVLVFTEESGLTVDQLRRSAWNSYHAGFRWVHQTSGQGLRPPWPTGDPRARLSWSECAERAGYEIVAAYTRGTRPLMPLDLPPGENPQISVTFFCVPKATSL